MARRAGWMAFGVLGIAMAACGGGGGRDAAGPGDAPDADAAEVGEDAAADGTADGTPDAADPATDLAGDSADLPDALPADVAWAGSDPFPLDGAFYAAHPKAFARMSRYATHVSGPVGGRPNVGHRGSFGAGNGHVFAFAGLADPLNTLHSMIGPTYERRPDFFGDYHVRLVRAQDSTPPDFEEEWAGRSLSAPVVLTRGRLGDLELDTIDVAPIAGSSLSDTCLFRVLLVRNRAAAVSPEVTLRVVANNAVTPGGTGALIETGAESDGRVRSLRTLFAGTDGALAKVDGKTLSLDIGAVPVGGEVLRVLAHCTGDAPVAAPVPANAAADDDPQIPVDPLWTLVYPETEMALVLDAVADRYGAWEADLVQVDVPDPMVADFLDGMKMTLKVQTAATGATCPMSEYTRTWARDNIGPVMAMLAFGGFDDVAGMLDYVYAAIRYTGDLSNSYDADLDASAAPAAPDWDSKAPLSGRVAAETPSYVIRGYGLWDRYTGDLARPAERWGLLRRCLFDQGFGPDRLLPFTGDETYRADMDAAMGLDLAFLHEDLTWSANSTLLWMGAAREMARLADRQGLADQRAEVDALAEEVETRSLPYYRLDDGCVAAFVWMDTLAKSPPFEDVSLQVTWAGAKDGDDPFAQAALDCLVQRLGRAPGEIVSRPDPLYEGMFDAWEGVYTGMLPGYTLAAMTDTGHPQAPDAFAAVRLSLDTSGNLQEDMIYDDHSGLSVAYDAVGALGDYTAKFRPWEGGIVAEAAMRYLAGFAPDAPARTLSLRPHLPAGWPRMAFRGLRAGSERFDLEVERDGTDGVAVTVTRAAGGSAADAWRVDLRWDAPSGRPGVDVDGTPVPEGDLARTTSRFGTVSVRTEPLDLASGTGRVFTVR